MTKKVEFSVELYASWARYRNDLLRIEARCFGHYGDDEAEFESAVRKALFLAVLKKGDAAIGYAVASRKWPDTVYLDFAAIDPDYQKKGHLPMMMGAVEDELRKIGYTYLERDSRVGTGYADKLLKHYGDRVLFWWDHPSRLGTLRFFRIKLDAERQQEPETGRQAPNPVSPDGNAKSDEGHSGSLPGT